MPILTYPTCICRPFWGWLQSNFSWPESLHDHVAFPWFYI